MVGGLFFASFGGFFLGHGHAGFGEGDGDGLLAGFDHGAFFAARVQLAFAVFAHDFGDFFLGCGLFLSHGTGAFTAV